MNWKETLRPKICKLPAGTSLRQPEMLIATWFGTGLVRPAAGTVGSLAALPPALLIMWLEGPGLLLIAAFLAFAVGYWAARIYERKSGEHDASSIVIDEVAGQWLTLLPAGLNPWLWLAGFLLFRFFDAAKPWPVSWADKKLNGAFGVMFDDILAALYAMPGVAAIAYLFTQL